MRHRRTVAALSLIVLTIAALSFARIHRPTQPAAQPAPVPHLTYHGPATFWDYQCIDTMKTSRDRTREWAHRPDLPQLIDEQVSLVAATGANCIAIGTPYDPEFMPVLQTWVASARTHHLRVWFRGNFCGWEGWFGYPRTLTTAQLLNQTDQFIAANPGLFSDGDQFTAAPEAENGGPFKPAGAHFITDYRAFLTAQTDRTAGAFARIGKHVGTNWASMSGGVARSILDRTTIDNLGGLVTLDHYVPAATAMTNEVDYYHDHFGAHVVVGEWGAPIPDINGPLTSDQQTNLVTQILAGLATRHNYVDGVSYWTLTGGTTGLTDDNGAVAPFMPLSSAITAPPSCPARCATPAVTLSPTPPSPSTAPSPPPLTASAAISCCLPPVPPLSPFPPLATSRTQPNPTSTPIPPPHFRQF